MHDAAEPRLWLRAPALASEIAGVQNAAPALRSAVAQRQVLNIERCRPCRAHRELVAAPPWLDIDELHGLMLGREPCRNIAGRRHLGATQGTCCRAANWVDMGMAERRGRQEQVARKCVFVHPLPRSWRQILTAPLELPCLLPTKRLRAPVD